MFEEFDRIVAEEHDRFSTIVAEILNKQHEEFCAELDKIVNDSIEESHKETAEMLRESGFSEDDIKKIMGDSYIEV